MFRIFGDRADTESTSVGPLLGTVAPHVEEGLGGGERVTNLTGAERYVQTLEGPRPGDRKIISDFHRYARRMFEEGKILSEADRNQARDSQEETKGAFERARNEVLIGVLPRVTANIKRILVEHPDLLSEGPHGPYGRRDEEKIAGDLSSLLDFRTDERGKLLLDERYPLSLIYYLTDSRFYSAGIRRIVEDTISSKSSEVDHTSFIDIDGKRAIAVLADEGETLARSLLERYQFRFNGNVGAPSFEYWARKIDPEYYQRAEDSRLGIIPQ